MLTQTRTEEARLILQALKAVKGDQSAVLCAHPAYIVADTPGRIQGSPLLSVVCKALQALLAHQFPAQDKRCVGRAVSIVSTARREREAAIHAAIEILRKELMSSDDQTHNVRVPPQLGAHSLRTASALSAIESSLLFIGLLCDVLAGASITVGRPPTEPTLSLRIAYVPWLCFRQARTEQNKSRSASQWWANPCLAQLLCMPVHVLRDVLTGFLNDTFVDLGVDVLRELQAHHTTGLTIPSKALEWARFMKHVDGVGRCLQPSLMHGSPTAHGTDAHSRMSGMLVGSVVVLRTLLAMMLTQEVEFVQNAPLLTPATDLACRATIFLAALVRRQPDVISGACTGNLLTKTRSARPDGSEMMVRMLLDTFADTAPTNTMTDDDPFAPLGAALVADMSTDELFRYAVPLLSKVIGTVPSPNAPFRRVCAGGADSLLLLLVESAMWCANQSVEDIYRDDSHLVSSFRDVSELNRVSVIVTFAAPCNTEKQNDKVVDATTSFLRSNADPPQHFARGAFSSMMHLQSGSAHTTKAGTAARDELFPCAPQLLNNIAADLATAFALRTLSEPGVDTPALSDLMDSTSKAHQGTFLAELLHIASTVHHHAATPSEVRHSQYIHHTRMGDAFSDDANIAAVEACAATHLLHGATAFVLTNDTTSRKALVAKVPHAFVDVAYRVDDGRPLCPMPLAPWLGHVSEHVTGGWLFDEFNPVMKANALQRAMPSTVRQRGKELFQGHPAIQQWHERETQSQLVHKRRLEDAMLLIAHDVQVLYANVLHDDVVLHVFMCSSTDVGDDELESELRWCLGARLLQRQAPSRAATESSQRVMAGIPAKDFCDEFFPLVAHAPIIIALRNQRNAQSRISTHKADMNDDEAFLDAVCQALEFPHESYQLEWSSSSESPGLQVLLTVQGVRHVDQVRGSIRALMTTHQALAESPHDHQKWSHQDTAGAGLIEMTLPTARRRGADEVQPPWRRGGALKDVVHLTSKFQTPIRQKVEPGRKPEQHEEKARSRPSTSRTKDVRVTSRVSDVAAIVSAATVRYLHGTRSQEQHHSAKSAVAPTSDIHAQANTSKVVRKHVGREKEAPIQAPFKLSEFQLMIQRGD